MNLSISRQCTCGKSDFKYLKKYSFYKSLYPPDRAIVKCVYCGLITRVPSIFELNDLKENPPPLKEYSAFIGDGNSSAVNVFLERLKKAERLAGKGPVLEVGAGSGGFMEVARSQNWDCLGTELSSSNYEALKTKGYNMLLGDLDADALKGKKFNLVHVNHVFEHVKDPLGFLHACKKLLAEKGIIIIEVPNEFDAVSQQIKMLFKLKDQGPTSYYEHEYFYSIKSLKKLVKRTGMDILKIGTPYRKSKSKSRNIIYYFSSLLNRGEVIELILQQNN